MRTLLLATAAILVATGGAFAEGGGQPGRGHGGHGDHGGPRPPQTVEDYYAAALAVNLGVVARSSARTSDGHAATAAMSSSFNGGRRGVANVNQNAGANSAQQNAVAVAYIEGCDCTVVVKSAEANSNAVAANGGAVIGNRSAGGGEEERDHDHGDRRSGGSHGGGGHGGSGGASALAAMDNSFNGYTGVAQANQNAGANSAQQNATSVVYVAPIAGAQQDREAWAIAANIGVVGGNSARDSRNTATATMNNSFGSFVGAANVNQNAGANSLQQNATSLAAIEYCNCAQQDLSTTIAAAANFGGVALNRASASAGSATASMTSSFNGGMGVVNVNQNAGANSLSQNSIAVGAIYQR
jgi:hypothetical protein